MCVYVCTHTYIANNKPLNTKTIQNTNYICKQLVVEKRIKVVNYLSGKNVTFDLSASEV